MYYIIIILDIFLVSLLFLCATLVAGLLKTLSPDIFPAQAVNVSVTLWFAAIFALQPALWMKKVHKWKRFLAWLLAVLGGGILYLLMELAAVYFLVRGNASFIFYGHMSNIIFMFMSPFLCSRLMSRFKILTDTELIRDKLNSVTRQYHKQTHGFQILKQTKGNVVKEYNKQKKSGKYGWMWILFGILFMYFIGLLMVLNDIK